MSQQYAFDRILASLSDAMLDDSNWSVTAALIDDAVGAKGNFLVHSHGNSSKSRHFSFARLYYHGQRDKEWEHRYFDLYLPRDERVPRLRRLPDSRISHVRDLYTEQELKTSPVYNEAVLPSHNGYSLNVRLDGPSGSLIVWSIADPVDGESWSSAQIEMIGRMLPHIRQFVRVRQALADAEALDTSLVGLLDIVGAGVIQLDRRGRIVAVNDVARDLLAAGDGLSDQGGTLSAWSREDDAALQQLLASALPRFGGACSGGSMLLRRPYGSVRLVLHVSPVSNGQLDFSPWRVAALALVADPGRQACVDPELAMAALGLTPAESHVAVLVAEGKTIREIAVATGRSESTIRWHVRQIFNKHGISRLQQLVQLVLSLAGVPWNSTLS